MSAETFEAITILAVMFGGGSILLCISGLIVAIWERLRNKPMIKLPDNYSFNGELPTGISLRDGTFSEKPMAVYWDEGSKP